MEIIPLLALVDGKHGVQKKTYITFLSSLHIHILPFWFTSGHFRSLKSLRSQNRNQLKTRYKFNQIQTDYLLEKIKYNPCWFSEETCIIHYEI